MKITVQIVIEREELDEPITEEVACLCRGDLIPETMGLTLAEGKELLAAIQEAMVKHQAEEYVDQQRNCPHCGKQRRDKGRHEIVWRSLFGKLRLHSPRLYTCSCRPQKTKSLSPLAILLPERSGPELLYLQTKCASLMSYGLTVDILADVLPMQTNTQTVILNTQKVAEKYEGDAKCFSFVHDYDEKPKRRLYEMLQSQGLQMNQDITFLSDGGDTVRDLQLYISPWSEHVLDWFHVTMRLTVMRNTAKGLPDHEYLQNVSEDLDRVKWYLWHGNVFRALELLYFIEMDLEIFEVEDEAARKLLKAVQDFHGYIEVNQNFIPNYGERHQYGERISTAFVESTINWVVSKRMVKKQQMRWTKRGAHLLLQARTKTLNEELRDTFCNWYPSMTKTVENLPLAA